MRWTTPNNNPIYDWHPWFAWHFIVIGSDRVWLEMVERKKVFAGVGSLSTYWKYRNRRKV